MNPKSLPNAQDSEQGLWRNLSAKPLVLLLEATPNGTYIRPHSPQQTFPASYKGLTWNRLTTGAYAPPLDSRPGFGVSLSIKDANHALTMAKDHGVELPTLQISQKNMEAAREYGGECLDSSSMYGILRQKAGLEFWNEKSRKGGA